MGNNEMIFRLLDDEQAFDDDIREHLSITAFLQNMLDTEAKKQKRPHHRCSKAERKK
jgi:predicted transposase YbfD/YdcC